LVMRLTSCRRLTRTAHGRLGSMGELAPRGAAARWISASGGGSLARTHSLHRPARADCGQMSVVTWWCAVGGVWSRCRRRGRRERATKGAYENSKSNSRKSTKFTELFRVVRERRIGCMGPFETTNSGIGRSNNVELTVYRRREAVDLARTPD
jgi:hypothetical protein